MDGKENVFSVRLLGSDVERDVGRYKARSVGTVLSCSELTVTESGHSRARVDLVAPHGLEGSDRHRMMGGRHRSYTITCSQRATRLCIRWGVVRENRWYSCFGADVAGGPMEGADGPTMLKGQGPLDLKSSSSFSGWVGSRDTAGGGPSVPVLPTSLQRVHHMTQSTCI
jgi:hypothetical protein